MGLARSNNVFKRQLSQGFEELKPGTLWTARKLSGALDLFLAEAAVALKDETAFRAAAAQVARC